MENKTPESINVLRLDEIMPKDLNELFYGIDVKNKLSEFQKKIISEGYGNLEETISKKIKELQDLAELPKPAIILRTKNYADATEEGGIVIHVEDLQGNELGSIQYYINGYQEEQYILKKGSDKVCIGDEYYDAKHDLFKTLTGISYRKFIKEEGIKNSVAVITEDNKKILDVIEKIFK